MLQESSDIFLSKVAVNRPAAWEIPVLFLLTTLLPVASPASSMLSKRTNCAFTAMTPESCHDV